MRFMKGTIEVEVTGDYNRFDGTRYLVRVDGKETSAWEAEGILHFNRSLSIPLLGSKSVTGFKVPAESMKEFVALREEVLSNNRMRQRKNKEEESHQHELYFACWNSDYAGHTLRYDDRDSASLSRLLDDGAKELSCCYDLTKIEKIVTEKFNDQVEQRNTNKKKFDDAVTTAKANNSCVLYSKNAVDCDGSVDECSVDILYVYINPDGTRTVERQHTY